MPKQKNHAVMFEMLRSFATLARTLNLSETVRTLGKTRQTIRRHINSLEEIKGCKLLVLEQRGYRLTDEGKRCLEEAESILLQTEMWLGGSLASTDTISGLTNLNFVDDNGNPCMALQHPLHRLWHDSPPILQASFQAWTEARFNIKHAAMDRVRAYLMLFRQVEDLWICAAIGNKSSYATWFSAKWVNSAVGNQLGSTAPRGFLRDQQMTSLFNELTGYAYSSALKQGNARLDHIYAYLTRDDGNPPQPVSYQRLLLGCKYPDGQDVLAVVIARTNRIEIQGLESDGHIPMPSELEMEYRV